jgi:hypothetical protein
MISDTEIALGPPFFDLKISLSTCRRRSSGTASGLRLQWLVGVLLAS